MWGWIAMTNASCRLWRPRFKNPGYPLVPPAARAHHLVLPCNQPLHPEFCPKNRLARNEQNFLAVIFARFFSVSSVPSVVIDPVAPRRIPHHLRPPNRKPRISVGTCNSWDFL